MPYEYGPIDCCQVCTYVDFLPVINLGYLPPVTTMLPTDVRPDAETRFPAEVFYCPNCNLVQLGLIVDPHILFHPDYPYTSGSTKVLRDNFADLHNEVCQIVGLKADDLVVDIGSNDGTLLGNFRAHRVVGIEPTDNAETAKESGIPTVTSFFNSQSVAWVKANHGSPKVITAANVFAHMNNIHEVVENIKDLMEPEGVFVSESHYLGGLIKTLQYDTIYHEHLRYYSVHSLKYLLEAHGMSIFHVTRIPTHGGSIRVYASNYELSNYQRYPVDDTVAEILKEEVDSGLTSDVWISSFKREVTASKLALYRLLEPIKRKGGTIYGIGAPARSTTLINYLGLDDGIVDCALEIKGSKKIGHFVPGTTIPILDESLLFEDQPEYALLLSWHIGEELAHLLRQRGYKGTFITPLPEPQFLPLGF